MSADHPTREAILDVKLLLGILRSLALNCRAAIAVVCPQLAHSGGPGMSAPAPLLGAMRT